MAFWRSERLDFSTVWRCGQVYCESDPMSSASPTPVAAPSLEQNHPKSGLRLVMAALLSALLPGTGHLLMKRWSKGVFILLVYAAVFAACFWTPLLRTLPGAVLTPLTLAK